MAHLALLIGSSQNRLDLLQAALTEAGWQVEVYSNPKEVLSQLQTGSYEAVYCDDLLRGASAPGLLAWTRKHHPNTAFYVFSNNLDMYRFRVSGEPSAILPYPPVVNQLPIPLGDTTLEQKLIQTHSSLSGNTSTIALYDVLDMLAMTEQNIILELELGKKGLIYMYKGMLEHAVAFSGLAPTQGLKALGQLIQLEDTEFRVIAYQAPHRATINLPVTTAMTEASRLADEEQRYTGFMTLIQKTCPGVKAIAVGYPLALSPNQGVGDANTLFTQAKDMLLMYRDAMNSKVTELFLCTDSQAFAILTLNKDNMIAASAPLAVKTSLLKAMNAVQEALLTY